MSEKIPNSANITNVDVEHCRSRTTFTKYKQTWTIEDFEFTCQENKIMQSSYFPVNSGYGQWFIQLQTTELSADNTNLFHIYLKNTNSDSRRMHVSISIYDSSKKVANLMKGYTNNREWTIISCELYAKLLRGGSLPDDVTIVCELTYGVTSLVTRNTRNTLLHIYDSKELISQIESSIENETFTDVTFKVENETFAAHKLIVSLRSPVFAAMFKNNMIETLTSTVEIKDMKATIFKKMLDYIYSDQVENLSPSAIELCYAAEKYGLDNLKIMCVNNLYENLSCKTVIKTLELADVLSIAKLKEETINFIVSNLTIIREKEEFNELIEGHVHLALEIFSFFKPSAKV